MEGIFLVAGTRIVGTTMKPRAGENLSSNSTMTLYIQYEHMSHPHGPAKFIAPGIYSHQQCGYVFGPMLGHRMSQIPMKVGGNLGHWLIFEDT